jgi:hypothetical protein
MGIRRSNGQSEAETMRILSVLSGLRSALALLVDGSSAASPSWFGCRRVEKSRKALRRLVAGLACWGLVSLALSAVPAQAVVGPPHASSAAASSTVNAVMQVESPASPTGPTWFTGNVDLTQDATWTTEGSPYVIDGSLKVRAGATLTILPGTIVKFVPAANLYGQLVVTGGRLLAQGTGANPVVFTSYFDDSAGGDTDGGGRAPERGDWEGLGFGAPTAEVAATMPTSVLENVSVRYGGEGFSCLGGEEVGVGEWGKLEVSRSRSSSPKQRELQ